MAEPLSLARYHEAVTSTLKKITWVRDAGAYPEKNIPRFTGLVTPAVYFTINSWEQNGGNEGQLNVELSCDLFVVVDAASGLSCPEIFLRTAAADITQWIDGQQFGLTHISPAVFTTAERDEFDPRMDDYLVWRVSFTQSAAFGVDPFARTGMPLNQVWLGAVPDTGRQHVDDYHLIWEASTDE
ncbi:MULTISPECIES: hypothetical protein [unclassified Citrobacter]|uniref:hypothetical protein n=1 Tax=unclassified Citrobacter TaxID=2644389 RepID=UPI0010C973BA|nr:MULTISPECIES: hypothetical protein [unclassified Citrobacter]TKU54845.1 hypothetical protein FDX08_06655 [Citrobacter sp. wls712]